MKQKRTYQELKKENELLRQQQQLLQENANRFNDIAGNALEWIWEVDKERKYTYSTMQKPLRHHSFVSVSTISGAFFCWLSNPARFFNLGILYYGMLFHTDKFSPYLPIEISMP